MIDFDATVLAACSAAFGETVQYYTAQTGPFAVSGIFNDRYQQTKFEDGIEIVDTAIVLGIRAAQFPVQPVQGDHFFIRNVLYRISDPVEPDGLGDLKIRLTAASNEDAARLRLPPGSL
jgi:hypothetical protein